MLTDAVEGGVEFAQMVLFATLPNDNTEPLASTVTRICAEPPLMYGLRDCTIAQF